MMDDSIAVMARDDTAYRLMRSAAFCGGVDDNFYLSAHYVRGELKGYVVVKNGTRMTEDDIKPFTGG